MASREFKLIREEALRLEPEEQVQLAVFLLHHSRMRSVKTTGDLSEFKGTLRLSVDPQKHQRRLRAEWP
jgi:hypothetical protein